MSTLQGVGRAEHAKAGTPNTEWRFMVPMRVRWLDVEAFHEQEGRAGCPHPAAGLGGHHGKSLRGEDTAPYPPWAVQAFKARKIFSEKPHLAGVLNPNDLFDAMRTPRNYLSSPLAHGINWRQLFPIEKP